MTVSRKARSSSRSHVTLAERRDGFAGVSSGAGHPLEGIYKMRGLDALIDVLVLNFVSFEAWARTHLANITSTEDSLARTFRAFPMPRTVAIPAIFRTRQRMRIVHCVAVLSVG